MTKIIKNVDNLDVSFNEYMLKNTVQRVVDRLFENDQLLERFYTSVFGQFMIYEWSAEGRPYSFGDVVWFRDSTAQKSLHILRCDKTENSARLDREYPEKGFTELGWQDLNPDVNILVQYGIAKKIQTYVQRILKTHANDETLHKYGKVTYGDSKKAKDIDNILAKRDMSNLSPSRENVFFPYETYTLQPAADDAITHGICRKYDNGLMEYDITFRLGYRGYQEVDADYGVSADVIGCNDLNFQSDHSMDRYFYSNSDMSIFQSTDEKSQYEAEIGETLQVNRNDYVNTYAAQLNFAGAFNERRFVDSNYMVFSSDVLCQDRDFKYGSLNVSPNSMTFCAKKPGSVTALLVTYPNMSNFSKLGYNARNGGLMSNSFHCKLVGRWK